MEQNKSKSKELFWTLFVLSLLLAIFLIFSSRSQERFEKALKERGVKTKAFVTKTFAGGGKGAMIRYEYYVNGEKIELRTTQKKGIEQGDTIEILYLPETPEKSRPLYLFKSK